VHTHLRKSDYESLSTDDNQIGPSEDPVIGCTLLGEPFFFEESDWIRSPPDFRGPIVSGKGYNMETGTGLALWKEMTLRLTALAERAKSSISTCWGSDRVAAAYPRLFGLSKRTLI
jgi:hypothetical protein